jgi:hypothetical protein
VFPSSLDNTEGFCRGDSLDETQPKALKTKGMHEAFVSIWQE